MKNKHGMGSLSCLTPPNKPPVRIQAEEDGEEAPEHAQVGFPGGAQEAEIALAEGVDGAGVHREIHKPLVLQEIAQHCGTGSVTSCHQPGDRLGTP